MRKGDDYTQAAAADAEKEFKKQGVTLTAAEKAIIAGHSGKVNGIQYCANIKRKKTYLR